MKVQLTVAAIVVSVLLLAFWLWPYSDEFTAEHGHAVDEIVRIIEETPTKEGVDKALQYYHSRETRLQDRFKWGLKPDSRGAISETVRSSYSRALTNAGSRISDLGKKHPDLKRDIDYLSNVVTRINR